MKNKNQSVKLIKGIAGVLIFLVISYILALIIARGPVAAYRILSNFWPTVDTYTIFPQREIATAFPVSRLEVELNPVFPKTINFSYKGKETAFHLSDLLKQTDTRAFIVIKNDHIIYESYPNGGNRNLINTSFSVAKSFVSTLIGIAIDEGKIGSVKDFVIQYLPELKGRGLDSLTIKDLLRMSSGVPYEINSNVFLPVVPFSDDPRVFYSPNLREIALSVKAGDEPIGEYFRYNDYYLLLEGMILERVTGSTISKYLEDKVWKPMGMEFSASWSLDSDSDGFEKTGSGINARAIDFARFGLMFLHQGKWNGHQIVSEQWIKEAINPDKSDNRLWKVFNSWPKRGGYYGYHWWGLNKPDGTFDYMARGNLGQIIYISPNQKTVIVRFGNEPNPDILWPVVLQALVQSLSTINLGIK